MNLYEVLGVGSDASARDIKAAYRRLCKSAHPDVGGNAEAFTRIKTAYDVLSDAARRKRYDDTGAFDDKTHANPDQGALTIISNMLSFVLTDAAVDPTMRNVVKDMTETLRARMVEINKDLQKAERGLRNVQKLRKRFSRKSGGDNVFEGMLSFNEEMARKGIEAANAAIKDHHRAIEILADYEYRRDQPPEQIFPSMFSGQTTSASSVFGW